MLPNREKTSILPSCKRLIIMMISCFFRLIRKQRKTNSEGDELMVDGCLNTDKESIRGCWADYFEDLSAAKDDPTFDNMHQNMVDIDVDCIWEKLKDVVPSEEISTDEVMRAIGKLIRGKASDKLGLGAEHIIHCYVML